ncbi:MAG: hypothetical protein EOP84_35170 [Verrucomicrobiaceae bacterium]|nr:MAG: hypothetical protein EOP84_35170 [Verrucomicrobiaceae bacterium]
MKPDDLLEGLILQFRRGLVLRRFGRLEEAQELLEVAVPAEVERWSETATGLRPEAKKTKLREIFLRELGRVEDAFLVYELLSERIERDIIPALCSQVSVQVNAVLAQYFAPVQEVQVAVEEVAPPVPSEKPPRRVPQQISFDDIPGMIDMLLDRECQRRSG